MRGGRRHRSRLTLLAAAAAMALALTACAWIGGIGDLSLTGDGGPGSTTDGDLDVAADAPGVDAPQLPHDGSPTEGGAEDSAPGDGGATDGPSLQDTGATDAQESGSGDASDAGATVPPSDPQDPSAPCSMQPTYIVCDDFDEPGEQPFTSSFANPPWGWTSISGGGQILPFDLVHFTSSPRSAEFFMPATTPDASAPANAQLGITNPATSLTTSFRVAIDLRIDATSLDTGPCQVGVVQWVTDGGGTYNVLVENGVLDLSLGSSMRVPISGTTPPLQQWMRFVVVFDKSSGLTTIFDGVTVGTNAAGAGTAPGRVHAFTTGGVYTYGPSTPLTYEIDNVVLQGQ
ncbi:MAG: hypothetical protein ACRELB_07370 [Polyangiaceae bacterium]